MASSSDSSSAAAFDTYYQEFASLLQELEGPSSSSPGAAKTHKSASSSSSDSLYQQCVDLLSLMSLEARTTSTANNNDDLKFERLERVKIYKFQLEAVQQKRNTDFLMGNNNASDKNAFQMLQLEKERQQIRNILEQNETRAAQQNELLERAMASVHETEAVGLEILEETQRNRETIESAQGRVDELNGLASKAKGLVQKLSRPWWIPRR